MRWIRHLIVTFIIFLLANGAMIATILTPEIAYTTYNTEQKPTTIDIENGLTLSQSIFYDSVNYLLLREYTPNQFHTIYLQAYNIQGELLFSNRLKIYNNTNAMILVTDSLYIASTNSSNVITIIKYNLEGLMLDNYSISTNLSTSSNSEINSFYSLSNYFILQYRGQNESVLIDKIVSYNLETDQTAVVLDVANYVGYTYVTLIDQVPYQITYESNSSHVGVRIYEFIVDVSSLVTQQVNEAFYYRGGQLIPITLDKIVRYTYYTSQDSFISINVTDMSTSQSKEWYKPLSHKPDSTYIVNQQLIVTYYDAETRTTLPTATTIDVLDKHIGKDDFQLFEIQENINYKVQSIKSDGKDLAITRTVIEGNNIRKEIAIYHDAKSPGIIIRQLNPTVQFNLIGMILLMIYAIITYIRREEKSIPQDLQYPQMDDTE